MQKAVQLDTLKFKTFEKKEIVTGATYPELPELLKKLNRQKKVITRTAVEEVLIIQKKFAKFFGLRMFVRSYTIL